MSPRLRSGFSLSSAARFLRWVGRLNMAVVLGLFYPAAAGAQLPPGSLWHVVDSLCVPAKKAGTNPLPCLEVDLERGFAVLVVDTLHILVVPTRRMAGIESPELLDTGSPNYWDYAWQFRGHIRDAVTPQLKSNDFAMAINSVDGRSQDQLHIHLGCIRPDVQAALQIYEPSIGTTWSRLPFAVVGQRYRIMRLNQTELGTADPFKLVAGGIAGARGNMGGQTIVVAGAKFRDGATGFYLLASASTPNGESLLDYKCSVKLRSD
jgi:CDP-diacylglycerol pyrophosphatase